MNFVLFYDNLFMLFLLPIQYGLPLINTFIVLPYHFILHLGYGHFAPLVMCRYIGRYVKH